MDTCGYCKQRRHIACAMTRACACRERGHTLVVTDDRIALALMGARGTYHGWSAYAWSERCEGFHTTNVRATTRITARHVAHVTRSRVTQPRREVASSSVWNVRIDDAGIRNAARVSRTTALARGGFGL